MGKNQKGARAQGAGTQEPQVRGVTLDPRLRGIYNQAPQWAQFIMLTICTAMHPKQLDELVAFVAPRETDWNTKVCGSIPLIQFNGKSRSKIRAEVGDKGLVEVEQAFNAMGLQMAEDEVKAPAVSAPAPIDSGEETGDSTLSDEEKEPEDHTQDAVDPWDPNDPALPERVGEIPTRDLAGRPLDELLELEGMSPALAEKLASMQPAQKPAE
jgi:hypothetical protein